MAAELTAHPAPGGSAREVRAWWRAARPAPSLGRRLDLAYTVAITAAIVGALAYGTAASALASWITPRTLPAWGPPVAFAAMLCVARWGAYQGPVVFAVPDVGALLAAPLPRRALAAPRLVRATLLGAAGAVLVAALALVGLAGDGRGIDPGRAAGFLAGAGLCGALAVSAALAVEASPRWDRASRLAELPLLAGAAGLGALAHSGPGWRTGALWSGPWGWALQPVAGAAPGRWPAALALLGVVTGAAVLAAQRRCGACPTERLALRAEARAGAMASLTAFDARTARRSLRAAGAAAPGRTGPLRERVARAAAASVLRRPRRPGLAIPWRDAAGALRTPRRLLEAALLATGGALLCLLAAGRAAAPAAGALAAYAGAAVLLEPLRREVDAPGRARILLREPFGRVLLAHALLPAVVVSLVAAAAAAGCAAAGALPAHGAELAVLAVAMAPTATLCAALSARRGGRLSHGVLSTAASGDPSGGGALVLAWLVAWPAAAAALGGVPAILVARAGATALALAVALIAPAVLAAILAGSSPD